MITIVHLSHFFHDGGLVGAFLLGKRFKMFAEMTLNFLGGKAANVGVAFIQRNVCKVVKIAEQADFGELRNTREHDETNKLVAGLDVAIKRFQNGTVFQLKRLIVDGLNERLVVFSSTRMTTCLPVLAATFQMSSLKRWALSSLSFATPCVFP